MRSAAVLLVVATALAGCGGFEWQEPREPGDPVPVRTDLALQPFLDGIASPVAVLPAPAPMANGTLLVAQQVGVVELFRPDGANSTFLDLRDRVGTCHIEQGLLGLALSPAFGADGRLYVVYTDKPCPEGGLDAGHSGDVILARFTARPDRLSADNATEERLFVIPKSYRNHNGGHLAFGPDGMLYVGVGDGGGYGDPFRNGQDLTTLLGKVLRLDVGPATGYAVPPDNPFVGLAGARGEIWAYGLRNPWTFAFDSATGDLWVSDVGEDDVEEANHLPAGRQAGANLGWSVYEGRDRFRSGLVPEGLTFPVAQYRHRDGHCSISGGPVLRGNGLPLPDGTYLVGDFCSGRVWGVVPDGEGGFALEALMDTGLQVTGFALDADGGVLVLHWGGAVRRLVEVKEPTDGSVS